MGTKEVEKVNEIIRQLKNGEIQVPDVPEEFQDDLRLIQYERAAGMRLIGKRGFDIISDSFFVEEELISFSKYKYFDSTTFLIFLAVFLPMPSTS